jgi:hypothetical protein
MRLLQYRVSSYHISYCEGRVILSFPLDIFEQRKMGMMITLPDPDVQNLLIALACADGKNDAESARNAAKVIRDNCGESGLTRLLDRLAEQVDWAKRF